MKVSLIHVFYAWTNFFPSVCVFVPCSKMSNSTRNALKKFTFFSVNMWVWDDEQIIVMILYTLNSWWFLLLNSKLRHFQFKAANCYLMIDLGFCFVFLKDIYCVLSVPELPHFLALHLTSGLVNTIWTGTKMFFLICFIYFPFTVGPSPKANLGGLKGRAGGDLNGHRRSLHASLVSGQVPLSWRASLRSVTEMSHHWSSRNAATYPGVLSNSPFHPSGWTGMNSPMEESCLTFQFR